MEYCVAIIWGLLCGGMAYAALDIEISKKIHLFYRTCIEGVNIKVLSRKQIYMTTGLIFVISLSAVIKILRDTSDILNISKMLLSICILTGSACFDYREHRIPNIFPIMMSISAIIILITGLAIQQEGAEAYMVSSAFATVGCAACLTIASLLTKQGIGAGDIKIMSALALIGGVSLVCSVLFFSVVSCSVVSAVYLISRKKTLKSSLPFGPFILFGFIISIFTSMY